MIAFQTLPMLERIRKVLNHLDYSDENILELFFDEVTTTQKTINYNVKLRDADYPSNPFQSLDYRQEISKYFEEVFGKNRIFIRFESK